MQNAAGSLHGTLDLLILKTLARDPNHGFGISLHIKEASAGLLAVEEGSLYPALHRLERAKLIQGHWRATANARRARYYSLTASGRKRLAAAEDSWNTVAQGVTRMMRFA
ncbi:MAG: PadR family transcriptional regulator [Acidobacteriia bacterium]|nr:PadR family transcriptional regulator [Terriglobia bacterium]